MSRESDQQWNLQQVAVGTLSGSALGEVIRRGAMVVQTEAGIVVDGLCGPDTISHLGIESSRTAAHGPVPIPKDTRADIERVYGTFDYEEGTRGAILIDTDWSREHIVRVQFHTGQHTWAHRLLRDEMIQAYQEACEVSRYTPEKIWSWVARHKRHDPSKGLSRHSWGIAFDVDPQLHKPNTTTGPLCTTAGLRWVQVWKDLGWTWGGNWGGWRDPMHFQRTTR